VTFDQEDDGTEAQDTSDTLGGAGEEAGPSGRSMQVRCVIGDTGYSIYGSQ